MGINKIRTPSVEFAWLSSLSFSLPLSLWAVECVIFEIVPWQLSIHPSIHLSNLETSIHLPVVQIDTRRTPCCELATQVAEQIRLIVDQRQQSSQKDDKGWYWPPSLSLSLSLSPSLSLFFCYSCACRTSNISVSSTQSRIVLQGILSRCDFHKIFWPVAMRIYALSTMVVVVVMVANGV